jgi:hypothetical protein
LCGNSIVGICSENTPIVIPRAHDCCTLFLGSKELFKQHFGGNPSLEWSSAGYMERGDSYIWQGSVGKMMGFDKTYEELEDEYGSENASFIWKNLHPENHSSEMIFINIPGTENLGYIDRFKKLAEDSRQSIRIINGDMRLLKGLLSGKWNDEEYLIVPPGNKIKGVYDLDKIITF